MKNVLNELRSWLLVALVLVFALVIFTLIARFDTTWTTIPPQPSANILQFDGASLPHPEDRSRPMLPGEPYPAPGNAPVVPTPIR